MPHLNKLSAVCFSTEGWDWMRYKRHWAPGRRKYMLHFCQPNFALGVCAPKNTHHVRQICILATRKDQACLEKWRLAKEELRCFGLKFVRCSTFILKMRELFAKQQISNVYEIDAGVWWESPSAFFVWLKKYLPQQQVGEAASALLLPPKMAPRVKRTDSSHWESRHPAKLIVVPPLWMQLKSPCKVKFTEI